MAAQAIPLCTPQEYMTLEKKSDFKSEYISGHILAMAGGSLEHNNVKADLLIALGTSLRIGGYACDVHDSDQKVNVGDYGPYFYPDLSIVCGETRVDKDDCLLNPIAIFEVLSPSTSNFDRGEKFYHYRRIETLREYVLVHLSDPLIEHYSRSSAEEDSLWTLREIHKIEAVLTLAQPALTIPFSEIYRRVHFE